jgi:hypothetical protein
MVWKIVTLFFAASTIAVLGLRVASAQVPPAPPAPVPPPTPPAVPAAACNNQPNMAAALDALRSAYGLLEKASDNKGGWRVQAMQSTGVAISKTAQGCSFADTH